LGEVSFDEKGDLVRRLDPTRYVITTYTNDDYGKRIGQQVSLPDDPDLRAALASQEAKLLAQLRVAGNNQQQRETVLHDLLVFYTSQSLEFDKAASLQFLITNRDQLYSLKLTLACVCKTYAERNKNLEALIQEFPEKKAFTTGLMVK
ncbi:MAG TPA: hypothetical protein VG733_16880, partial [Chthoniobacteraceae bacterium]|nr:hypothetical protein [Chthoniobacteraceae bacterium]